MRKKWDYYIELEYARRGDLTLWEWILISFENVKVSLLYLFRLTRNFFFCAGNRMPLNLELQRHVYHFNLSARLFKKVKINPKILFIVIFTALIYFLIWASFLHLSNLQIMNGRDDGFILPVYGSDSVGYVVLADNILNNQVFSGSQIVPYLPDTFRTPGYPLLLAGFKAIFGSYALFPLLQILMVLGTAFLIYKIGAKLFSEVIGFAATFLYILDPNTIFHTLVLLSDIPYVFFLLLAVYFIFFSEWKKFYILNLAGGIFLGLTTLIRPISMFLLILLLPFYFLAKRNRFSAQNILAGAAILIVGYSLMVAPWMIRNKAVAGVWGISSVGAFNLFHYNIPEFLSFKYGITPDEARLSLQEKLGDVSPRDIAKLSNSELLNDISLRYLKEDTIGYAKFHLIKTIPFFFSSGIKNFFAFYNDIQGYNTFQVTTVNMTNLLFRRQIKEFMSALKSAPLIALENFSWLFIATFAFIPTFFSQKNRWLMLMFLFIIFYFAILTGPVAYSRFRLPASPFLFLLAAGGFLIIWNSLLFRLNLKK